MAVAGDDAFDLALDTREILENPILGPLSRGALERVAPGLDPEEAVPPITRGLFGLPSPIALPKLERIYFRWRLSPKQSQCCKSCCVSVTSPLGKCVVSPVATKRLWTVAVVNVGIASKKAGGNDM